MHPPIWTEGATHMTGEELQAAARAIAKELGWFIDESEAHKGWCPIILSRNDRDEDTRTIHFRERGGRMEINAGSSRNEPDGWYFRPEDGWPTITVGAKRTPDAIAAEIRRRLLPELDRLWVEYIAKRTQHRAYESTKGELMQATADALGKRFDKRYPVVPPATSSQRRDTVHLALADDLYGDVKGFTAEAATFDLHVTGRERIVKLARFLATL